MEGKKVKLSLKKKLTNNLGLKILALVFAVILWLIVVNINDPVKTTTYYGVEVELLNTNAITDDGKTFEILNDSNIVNVTITAKKSVLSQLSRENIHATADLAEMTFMDTVGIIVQTDKLNTEIDAIKSNIVNLKLNIDDVADKQLFVELTTTGEPAEGYIIGDVSAAQNIVRLEGPKRVIESITTAKAVVDVTDMSANMGTSVEIELYDAHGKKITNAAVVKNITSLDVTVGILGTKTVPLEYTVMGTPVSGYALTGEIISSPEEITIAANTSLLRTVTGIEIPETALNVTGQSGNMTAVVDVAKFLPNGVRLADDDFNGKATVVVYIEEEVSVSAAVSPQSISMTNIPANTEIEIVPFDTRMVTFVGLQRNVDEIDRNSLTGYINIQEVLNELNLTEFSPGIYYDVEVEWNVPDTVRQKKVFEVQIFVPLEEEPVINPEAGPGFIQLI